METWKAPFFSLAVPDDFEGSGRLDKFISSAEPGFNRSKLKSGVTGIFVNSRAAKLSSKIRAGDKIEIYWEDSVPQNIEPEDIPLKVIFENDDVCAVDKEQGMVTHPAAGNWSGTLVNALLYRWKRGALQNGGPQDPARQRPGIVHRLDKDTSGVIVTAKNRAAEEWLQSQFRERRLAKEYILIVKGCPPKKDGIADTYIARDPADRKRFKAFPLDGAKKCGRFGEDAEKNAPPSAAAKRAATFYHVVSIYGGYSLVRARLITGRTHQIRVHMKFLGCPVLGDSVYAKKDPLFPNETLMLHSRLLRIRLPGQEKMTAFAAAVPERFKKAIRTLKEKYPRSYASGGIKKAEALAAHGVSSGEGGSPDGSACFAPERKK